MLVPALEEPAEASLGGKLLTTAFLQLVGNMNYTVIFHKPLKQWLVCFPKVILLAVWAEGIYESDFSRPRKKTVCPKLCIPSGVPSCSLWLFSEQLQELT